MSCHYSTEGSAQSWVPSSSSSASTPEDSAEAYLRVHISKLPLADQIEPKKLLRSLKLARGVRDAASQYESDGSCFTGKPARSDSGYGSESTGSSMMTHREERPSKQRNDVDEQINALRVCHPDFYERNWLGIWNIESARGCANDEPINHIRYQCLLELYARLEAKQNPNRIDLSLIEGGRAHKAIREAERFPDAFLKRPLSSIHEDARTPEGVNSERVEGNITGDILTMSHRGSADSMSLDSSRTIPVSEIPGQAALGISEAMFSDDGSQSMERPPPSDVPGRPDNQHEGTKAKRKPEIERLDLGPTRKISELRIINAIDIARNSRLSDDQTTSPISDLGIVVDPEVSAGADPATVSARIHDSAPPEATTPICETPISPSSSLYGVKLDPASPATSQSSQSPSSLLDSDLDYNSVPTSEVVQSPVLAQPASTAKVKEAPFNLEELKGIPVEKPWSRRDILSRLKPTHRITRPSPRQTMSRENLQHWLAQRAARRKERRARPPELGESDLTSMNFTSSSVSGVTDSEGSEQEPSLASFDKGELENEGSTDSSSGASGRRPGFEAERRRPVKILPAENAQPRQPERRGRFLKFSRSRPRPEYRRGLFGKLRRRKESGRIID